ncbi:hypothetical protein BDW59DRAFT_100500 [Aspergillus cavernicola]|uniref:Fumarylacetoacetase n=1 Tax=Aspergillus cavernicola TaxID=176166 RepID=A0ABR4I4U7_9EURO
MSSTPFPIDNLPYGVISTTDNPTPRCATVLENNAIDLSALEKDGYFKSIPGFENEVFSQQTLNTFAALPKSTQGQVRVLLTDLLSPSSSWTPETRAKYSIPLENVKNHFPMDTRNFSDFYCSLEHTQNCCALMGNVPIPKNWFVIPSVYNGRTSSLRISGSPIHRPNGVYHHPSSQDATSSPKFQPTSRFDFELEVGIFLSRPLAPGSILDINDAEDYIFGLVILNDWSARDIQMFEMMPLGPFHGKGAGTSISPWIVTTEALRGSLCASAKVQEPKPLGHLAWKGEGGEETWDVELAARVVRNGKSYLVTETNLKELYWTPYQQLTHLTSAGEGLSTGDIFGTGTVTSARTNSKGENTGVACLLERMLPQNELATLKSDGIVYLEDGDEVIMDGWCVNRHTGRKFGFGECRGVILPALEVGLK